MGFIGVYTALYDYLAQSDQELSLQEGDLLYVLEKSTEDEWWKAKRKTPGEDGEEPVGLVPSNYVQETEPVSHARALYDYTRQTDEEISLTEDAALTVYDTTDPDWALVGLDGEYGFAPANYIELREAPSGPSSQREPTPRVVESSKEAESRAKPTSASSPAGSVQSPAATVAGILNRDPPAVARPQSPSPSSPSPDLPARRPTYTPEASDDDDAPTPKAPPVLPTRPASQSVSSARATAGRGSVEPPRVRASPPFHRAILQDASDDALRSPGGFHLYNVSEMVSAMGKRKKMPTTLGLNTATGTIMIAPEKSRDGPQQEWTAERLTHYSIEGKHVFLDLVRPSRSVDFHAGAKDTAEEIVSALGEIAGAAKAEGLREVLAAGSSAANGRRRGQVLYDFVAQGDDEVTVGVGDEVVILDDTKSEEWWMVKRVKDGKEGVMPSSYAELARTSTPRANPIDAARSVAERNRLEEERLTKQAVKAGNARQRSSSQRPDVGLGVALPQRGSSLMSKTAGGRDAQGSQRHKGENRSGSKSGGGSRPKPESSKIRTWTDRSGSFKVEAEFIGCTDGKIHLHKLNGVKIAVPVAKMATRDLEFVERITGLSLDEDKPLSEIKRRSRSVTAQDLAKAAPGRRPNKDEYDWFDFFLKCGVNPQLCERYSSSFLKDSMDETVLPDITSAVLRTLGLKEGDILKVMKHLDGQYGRAGTGKAKRNVSFGDAEAMRNGEGGVASPSSDGGGLFSGPGGTLRNNTRKGRPAPPMQTKDVVDSKVFEQAGGADLRKVPASPSEPALSPTSSAPPPARRDVGGDGRGGFDDDAWRVKPTKEQRSASLAGPGATGQPSTTQASPAQQQQQQQQQPQQPQQPGLTGSMKELSLLSAPLQPAVAQSASSSSISPPPAPAQSIQPTNVAASPQPSQSTTSAPAQHGGGLPGQMPPGQPNPPFPSFAPMPQQNLGLQPTAVAQQQTSSGIPPRLRPQPPPQPAQSTGAFAIPPPPRPLSAPQKNLQPGGFAAPPLQPQLTGIQTVGGGFQPRPFGGVPPANLNNFAQPGLQQQQTPQFQLSNQPTNGQMPSLAGPGTLTSSLGTQPTGMQPMLSGRPGFQQSQPLPNGAVAGYSMSFAQPTGGPPAHAAQHTGFQYGLQAGPLHQQQQQQQQQQLATPQSQPQPPVLPGSINSFLPPPLQPRPTGMVGATPALGQPFPPAPPIPQQPTIAPLQSQKTGSAPTIRFGVAPEAKQLVPQPTGRRANLSQATPQNPFGF